MNYLKPIQLTNLTINPQLFPNETILQSQSGIGIYDGKNKDQRYQDGMLYLTSHRLIYVDRFNPHDHSCFLDISLIRQTEYWIGFLTSSPKITLLLGTPNLNNNNNSNETSTSSSSADHYQLNSKSDQHHILNHPATSHWACHVCGFSNLPESKCALCGIPKHLSSSNSTSHSSIRESTGLKSSDFQTTSLSDLKTSSNHSDPMNKLTIANKGIPCPSCTFLNHPSMARCEMCNSILGTVQLQNLTSNKDLTLNDNQSDLQHSRATTPAPPSSFPSGCYIRLSFRKGGDKTFYLHLKTSLQNKTWKIGGEKIKNQSNEVSNQILTRNSSSLQDSNHQNYLDESNHNELNSIKSIGIDRILKNMDSQHQAHHAELTESLGDLQALMTKAKEMVQMAQLINARMSNLESSTSNSSSSTKKMNNDDTELTDEKKKARLIRSSLVKLGLPAPAVTQDILDSDQDYVKELAKELAGLLNRKMDYHQEPSSSCPLLQSQSCTTGIWPLDQIWCIWNRARGISLVSPGDMILACQHLPEYTTSKIQLRSFKSGVKVLHTPYFSLEEFEARLIKRLMNQLNETNNLNIKENLITSTNNNNNSELIKNNSSNFNSFETLKKISTLEISQFERTNLNLTNELLQSIQFSSLHPINQISFSPPLCPSSSCIVCDFNPNTGVSFWFLNLISGFIWIDPNV